MSVIEELVCLVRVKLAKVYHVVTRLSRIIPSMMRKGLLYAIVAEWFKATDLKSVEGNTSVGSKPTYGANPG